MEDLIALNPNPLVRHLGKLPEEFTKRDLIKFVEDKNIEMVNFRYIAGDDRLKSLNFVITSKAELDRLLSTGERADGSSLFPYIDAGSSDVYVIPRYKTAFVNPFSEIPTLEILCSYYTKDGTPLPSAPDNILRKAHESLKASTGLTFEAMGELEYYVIADRQELYPCPPQKGYHESPPFTRWQDLRCEAMLAMARAGAKIKYAHSEVGSITLDDMEMEQNEIEFLPVNVEDAVDQMVVGKWILRMLGRKHGVTVSFAPKIMVGHAGSGLHIHTKLTRDGKSVMIENGELSDAAKKAIAGYLTLAPSLTAFGNTNPVSYLRLVPHQEAPTNICWGDRNRSVLVRVPLGWLNVSDMARHCNPQDDSDCGSFTDNQTVEFRCSDGSANLYLLLAGLTVAARHGLEMPDALDVAKKLYVDVNIFHDEHKDVQERLPQLPSCCWDSAESLLKDRAIYEKDGVFSPLTIDGIAQMLRAYNDSDLSERLYRKDGKIKELVDQFLHC